MKWQRKGEYKKSKYIELDDETDEMRIFEVSGKLIGIFGAGGSMRVEFCEYENGKLYNGDGEHISEDDLICTIELEELMLNAIDFFEKEKEAK